MAKIELSTKIVTQSVGGRMGMVGTATLSLRSRLSGQHFWIARMFANRAGEIEDHHQSEQSLFNIEHRGYVMASIQSSVAFFEAFINEVYLDIVDGVRTPFLEKVTEPSTKKMCEIWAKHNKNPLPTLLKYQNALEANNAEQFDSEGDVYENAELAIALRNELSHFNPLTRSASGAEGVELYPQRKKKKKLILESDKFDHCKLFANSGNPFFPDKCLGFGGATWVLRSCQTFADLFCERTGIQPYFRLGKYS